MGWCNIDFLVLGWVDGRELGGFDVVDVVVLVGWCFEVVCWGLGL